LNYIIKTPYFCQSFLNDSDNIKKMDRFSFLNTVHSEFIADLYEQYQENPDGIEPSWRSFFQGYDLANADYAINGEENTEIEIPNHVHKEFKVIELINGYRIRGHLFTKTNPVRDRRAYTPTLAIENFGLNKNDLKTKFNAGSILGVESKSLELAKSISEIPTKGLGYTKKLLNYSLNNSLDDQLNLEAETQALSAKSEDHKEGIQAFLEKRSPIFTGK